MLEFSLVDKRARPPALLTALTRTAECKAAGMRISTSESEVLSWRKVGMLSFRLGTSHFPRCSSFRYLGVFFSKLRLCDGLVW